MPRELGERVVLVFAEAGEPTEVARELNRVLVVFTAEASEVEDRVHRALELERAFASLGILLGQAAQPVGAHLHVRHFVGEHPVFAELEDRVAALAAKVLHRVEHVDRQAFERAVHAAQAQHRVGVARGGEQERRLGVLADLGAHVVAELHGDLAVTGLVPALARHVELELERRTVVVEVVTRATGTFERLDLTDEDAVHQRT